MSWFANLFPKKTFVGKLLGSKNVGEGIALHRLLKGDLSELADIPAAIKGINDANHDRTGGIKPSKSVEPKTLSPQAAKVRTANNSTTNQTTKKTNYFLYGIIALVVSKFLKLW